MEALTARQLDLFPGTVEANESRRHPKAVLEPVPRGAPKPSTRLGVPRASVARPTVTRREVGRQRTLSRIAVSPDEAAEMLGVSRDYFDEHVIDELRVVRRGRRILIALVELERWLDRAATSATVGRRS